jgi:hypothetical protein
MPYKIHIESRELAESPPLEIVETMDEAKASLRALVSVGVLNCYAVGYEKPPSPLTELGRA